jgi:hypothetical protein
MSDFDIEFAEDVELPPPLTDAELAVLEATELGLLSSNGVAAVPLAEASAHTWQAQDIVAVSENPPDPPAIAELFYLGKRHVLSGEPEAGKSTLLLAAAGDELKVGRGIVWVDDDDMGPAAVLERLRNFGVGDETISRLFAYVQPEEALGEDGLSYLLALIDQRDVRLVVFDTFDAALTLHGFNPNDTTDIERFWTRVVNPLCKAGVAVVLADHVTKNADSRGKWSIGSQRKASGAAVHIGMRAIELFGRGRTGRAKLSVHKDRPGFLSRPSAGVFVVASEPESGDCSWQIEPDHSKSEAGEFRPTVLMEKVSNYLELPGGPRTRKDVEANVSGRGEYIRLAIDTLVTEGYVVETPGEHGAKLLASETPYREEDEREL